MNPDVSEINRRGYLGNFKLVGQSNNKQTTSQLK